MNSSLSHEPHDNLTRSTPLESTGYTCGPKLESFHSSYAQVHGWASLQVCVFGSIANVLNIAVLTRREMHSPTNMILTGLAVADLLVMIEYIPYAIHMYLYQRSRRDTFTYGWGVFVLFHSNFGQVCHTISICLTVTLAIWRYIAVAYPQKNREWCSNTRTVLTIVGAYVFCPILCVPLYVTTEVRPQVELLDEEGMNVNLTKLNGTASLDGATNTTLYFVKLTETARMHAALKKMNFWIYSVVIKLIPCLALTVLSFKLIRVLVEAKRRRRKLTAKNTDIKMSNGKDGCEKPSGKKRRKGADKEKQTDRTTKMLLAVLALFLITEFPQGILGLFSVILGTSFFNTCYVMLGKLREHARHCSTARTYSRVTASREFT
ncbi:Probable G-protein coupled receptor B0563.6 [Harpegnathos saltator]|uniref:Probable G-protein coupled receptor B0563.6 n=1 Tax=Harpegnathos saltator TaxID=610380 RepID=E2C1G1_HARSA|nr:Probable G-protein coupled receptor B0563.6 [Harpegnathos saltator]